MVTYPADWSKKTFSDFIKIKRGASPRPIDNYITNSPLGINWIKIGDGSKNSKYITSTAERIIPEGRAKSVSVNAGDFLLSNSMSFGRPYILAIDGCIHDGWLCLSDFDESADSIFLFYLLSSSFIQEQYQSLAAGSGVQNLNKDVVNKVIVYLPSLNEQRAIAETLTQFDDIVSSLNSLIEKKRGIREASIHDLTSGITRLEDFNEDWTQVSLSQITDSIITGGTPSTANPANYGGNIPWLSSGEIHQKRITIPTSYITEYGLANSSAKIAPQMSVLVALAGQGKTRGTVALLMEPMALNQSLAALVVNDRCSSQFLYYLLNDKYSDLREVSSGDGGRGGLNKKLLASFVVRIPSSIQEQIAIADVIESMDNEISTLEAERDKWQQIRDGAMGDLLTGRVRLKDWEV